MTHRSSWAGLLLLLLDSAAPAGETPLRVLLENHCVRCHNEAEKKGGLDLTVLSSDLSDQAIFNRWLKVHDRVQAGEMPPKKRLQQKETTPALEWLARLLVQAEQARDGGGRTANRRLTRTELDYTLQDLFSLPGKSFAEDLPVDGRRYGFDKVGETLDISPIHVERYLDIAKRILDESIAPWPQAPKIVTSRAYPACDIDTHRGLYNGKCVLLKDKQRDPAYPLFDGIEPPAPEGVPVQEAYNYYRKKICDTTQSAVGFFGHSDPSFRFGFDHCQPVLPGRYKLRLSVWSFWWDQGIVRPSKKTQVAALRTSRGRLLGYFDGPSLTSKLHEVEVWLEKGEYVLLRAASLEAVTPCQFLPGNVKKYQGPGIAIDWIEMEGPIYDSWPLACHIQLFGKLPLQRFEQNAAKRGTLAPARQPVRKGPGGRFPFPKDHGLDPNDRTIWTVMPGDPPGEAAKLLRHFLPKAFRRPVNEEQAKRYVKMAQSQLSAGGCFEDAMRAAYQSALCSPEFLFHIEPKGRLDDWAIASRLSYLLWNSMPDEILAELAARGQLAKGGDTLKQQVRRMLKDPRSDRFIEDFTGQWLLLYDIAATTPDDKLYPEFRPEMQDSMVGETHAFFRELLTQDLGIRNLVDSEFAMLNGELGRFYGISEAPSGAEFRRVPLSPEMHRGGLLTQAAILKVTANGTNTSPVKRGAFVIDRLLGKPPDPPPASVTAIEPDLRGVTTLREQLARHRNETVCASCHRSIDPPGFALENYDVIGRWRTRYRSYGVGERSGARVGEGHFPVYYRLGMPVDASGECSDGTRFKGFAEFKQILLKDERQLARNFVQRLTAYATGREVRFADRATIECILDRCATVDKTDRASRGAYGTRSLLEELVVSELFLTK